MAKRRREFADGVNIRAQFHVSRVHFKALRAFHDNVADHMQRRGGTRRADPHPALRRQGRLPGHGLNQRQASRPELASGNSPGVFHESNCLG